MAEPTREELLKALRQTPAHLAELEELHVWPIDYDPAAYEGRLQGMREMLEGTPADLDGRREGGS